MLLLMLLSGTGGSSSDSTGPQSSGLSRQQGTALHTSVAHDLALMRVLRQAAYLARAAACMSADIVHTNWSSCCSAFPVFCT